MSLKDEIALRRAAIHTDDLTMSIGELANLYRDKELDIHPEFQRFYRWSEDQKSRLIESLLLGIPIPSIFVSQQQSGVWDVIDGLQRLSTIFQLMGVLLDEDGRLVERLVLCGTKYLPSLAGKRWAGDENEAECLDREQELIIKRAKLDVKIILRESDESSKYELFQRLNTGGSQLSFQELRNCILIMVNPPFYRWIMKLSKDDSFRTCVAVTDRALEEQYDVELVVRFLVFRRLQEDNLKKIGDVNEFLTDEIVRLAREQNYDQSHEEAAFRFTFQQLAVNLEDNCFCRYVPAKHRFVGGFLLSAYETIAIGLGSNYEEYIRQGKEPHNIVKVAHALWSDSRFTSGIGSGVRASSRIPVIIPIGRQSFKP